MNKLEYFCKHDSPDYIVNRKALLKALELILSAEAMGQHYKVLFEPLFSELSESINELNLTIKSESRHEDLIKTKKFCSEVEGKVFRYLRLDTEQAVASQASA